MAAHLAATHSSSRQRRLQAPTWVGLPKSPVRDPDPSTIYAQLANRLAVLIDDVREVGVDVDHQRELLTLFACGKDGTKHPARALSDGTLRFLALAVIELDPAAQGVLCLEEPENGIHPKRIPQMLKLLKEIAVDTDEPIGEDNPLRQVIINTHSPAVVSEVDEASLVFAQLRETVRDGQRFQSVYFEALSETWRTKGNKPAEEVSKGDILVYLRGPTREPEDEAEGSPSPNGHPTSVKPARRPRRVIDRPTTCNDFFLGSVTIQNENTRFTLVTDRTSDAPMLIPILEWLLRQHCTRFGINVRYADILQSPRRNRRSRKKSRSPSTPSIANACSSIAMPRKSNPITGGKKSRRPSSPSVPGCAPFLCVSCRFE